MNERDLRLYARTRVQLLLARADAEARRDDARVRQLDEQLKSAVYSDEAVKRTASRLQAPRQPLPSDPTVLDFVQGHAVKSSNPSGGAG